MIFGNNAEPLKRTFMISEKSVPSDFGVYKNESMPSELGYEGRRPIVKTATGERLALLQNFYSNFFRTASQKGCLMKGEIK